MGTFLVYILKSSACLAAFYLFYKLLLSRETFHRLNRIALLGILLLSCVLPLVKITIGQPASDTDTFMPMETLLAMYADSPATMEGAVPADTSFPWKEILVLCYLVGILFFIVRHLWSLGRLLYLIRHSQCRQMENGIRLIVHQKEFTPFSWMKYIVISQADLEENGHDILVHEQAHIHNRHSWDLLLAEVCIWLQWFNPAAWLLKQELQNIHEYEADEEVLRRGIDARHYQMLLIKKAVGARLYSIANSFNHSSLKKRITMMIRKKSNPWARAKYLYVLPLAAVAVAAFARPEISEPLDEISSVKVSDLSAALETYTDKNQQNELSDLKGKVRLSMKVVDENGQPVTGATVIIANTNKGTVTDLDGNFTLEVGGDQSIWVSYVGMESASLSVKECLERTDKTIRLTTSTSNMDLTVSASTPQSVTQDGEVFTVVEAMPEYPGGMAEALRFLARNLKYPMEAQKKGIYGRVIAKFVVKSDGTCDNFQVIRSISPELDAEALRVLKLMPKWKPGTQRGKAVDVWYTLPVSFSLQKKDGTLASEAESGKSDIVVVAHAPEDMADNSQDKTFSVVEQMPEYPGGMKALMSYLSENIKYPAECKQKGIQGRVIIQFVVKADGSLDNFKVLRSVDPLLDAEAIRVAKSMQNWKPGMQKGKAVDVKFTIPVTFSLTKKQEEAAEKASAPTLSIPNDPLILIDEKEVDKASLETMDPSQINSVHVIKDSSATAIYGKKAKNGVILVSTKKASDSGNGEMTVVGVVTDSAGKPVAGAAILQKGTTNGTVADKNGRFKLTVPDKDAVLDISFIDMKTATIAAKPLLRVTLEKE